MILHLFARDIPESRNFSNKNVEVFINKNFKDIDFINYRTRITTSTRIRGFFESIGIKTGPKMSLAKLETSKLFCREFLRVNNLSVIS